MITTYIEGKPIEALIDSGATQCMVGPKLFSLVPETKKQLTNISPPIVATAVNGQRIKFEKCLKISMNLDGEEVPVTALYSEEMVYPFIIGYSFLRENKLMIDFDNLTIRYNNVSPVKLVSATVLPPRSETTVWGYLKEPTGIGTGLVISSKMLQEKGLFAANALVTLSDDHPAIPVKILNLEERDVVIPQHFHIAECENISEFETVDTSSNSPLDDRYKMNANACFETQHEEDNTRKPGISIPPSDFTELFNLEDSALTKEEQKQLFSIL